MQRTRGSDFQRVGKLLNQLKQKLANSIRLGDQAKSYSSSYSQAFPYPRLARDRVGLTHAHECKTGDSKAHHQRTTPHDQKDLSCQHIHEEAREFHKRKAPQHRPPVGAQSPIQRVLFPCNLQTFYCTLTHNPIYNVLCKYMGSWALNS